MLAVLLFHSRCIPDCYLEILDGHYERETRLQYGDGGVAIIMTNIISGNGCDGGSEPHRDAARDTAALRNGGAGIHEQEQNNHEFVACISESK